MRKILCFFMGCVLLCAHAVAQAAPSGYCDSYGRNTYYFWQDSITVGDQTVVSGKNGGYNFSPSTNIVFQPGDNTLQLNPVYRSYNYTVYWRGWLDLNGDQQFTTDEQIFQTTSRGPVTVSAVLPETFDIASTTLRVAMKYGGYPSACQTYSYGETEDLVVGLQQPEIQAQALEDTYHLTADSSFNLHRTGAIGDEVDWVVEKNGSVVLQSGGAGKMEFSYYSNTAGSDIRIWLQQYIDGAYERVSNIVEYTPGTTNLYELSLSEGFQLARSGELGEPLTWVIEMDDEIVLERNAANELNYTYYRNFNGSHYRVWLKQFINGQYEVVSNTIEYNVGQTEFVLTLDQAYKVVRNGQVGDQVSWIVEENGMIVVDSDAGSDLDFTYMGSKPGAGYRIWLQMLVNGQNQVVSNVLEYIEPVGYAYDLSLLPGYQIQRSGELGEDLTWVVIKDGKVVLQRNAANELSYQYPPLTGSYYQVYLAQHVDGYSQRVSNIVRYEIRDFGYNLSVDSAYQVTRTGDIGEPVVWVVSENGQQILQQDASQTLSFIYPDNVPGAAYEVWLGMIVDGTFRPVSDVAFYQVPVVQPPEPSLTITLDADYVITRDGMLGDPLRWVVEENGNIVAIMDAHDSLSFVYPGNQSGAHYRIWLEEAIAGEIASNELEYDYSEVAAYTLVLNEDYSVERSGQMGEPLDWVLEENGVERWREDASIQPGFYFPFHVEGSVYRVWLVEPASQTVVSNVITYTYVKPGSLFTIKLHSDNTITRSGYPGDPLSWLVEENGVIVGDYSARDSLEFSYESSVPGAHYRIWLAEEGQGPALSNIISYQVPAAVQYDYSISLNTDGTITRSGAVGDEVDLIFIQRGEAVMGMDASRDLVLSFPFVSSGTYQVYLQSWPDAEPEQQVSNVLDITVP